MAFRGARLAVLLLAGCTGKSRPTDTWSKALPTVKERVDLLCANALCPTRPVDAAFHLELQDSGLFSGPGEPVFRAVVKVRPEEVHRWSMGCTEKRLPARPEWLVEVLAGTGWQPKTAPDTWQCGTGQRAIHVKEGLVLWWSVAE